MKSEKPKIAKDYLRQAEKHLHDGDFDSAIADLTIAIGPDLEAAIDRSLAEIEVRANLRRQGYFVPGDYDIFEVICLRGETFLAKGDYDRAISDFTQAISRFPFIISKIPKVYNSRGKAYEAKGDIEKANADFAKALGWTYDSAAVAEAQALGYDFGDG